jgi:uncharacterized protein (TIGR02145 family)
MKVRFPFIVFVPLILLFPRCMRERNKLSPGQIVVAKETRVIADQDWNQYFISMDYDKYIVTFSNNINAKSRISQGQILVSSVGEGFLRKVTHVKKEGNNIIVETAAASLTDVIKQGKIEFSEQLSVSKVERIIYHFPGMEWIKNDLKSEDKVKFSFKINAVLYDKEASIKTPSEQVKLTGEFNFDWKMKVLIDISMAEGLKSANLEFVSNGILDLETFLSNSSPVEKSYPVTTIHFSPIVVQVSGVPVVFTPKLDLILGINGFTQSKLSVGIQHSLNFVAGMKYLKPDGWKSYANYSKNIKFTPTNLNFIADAEVYCKPEFSTRLYGMEGTFANLKLYHQVEADVQKTPVQSWFGGLKMDAGVKAGILDASLPDFTISDLIHSRDLLAQQLLKANTVPVVNFNASKIDVFTGESIQFIDQSTDSPTSWQWDFGDGTNSVLQNPIKKYTGEGTYTVTLSAVNGFGSGTPMIMKITVTDLVSTFKTGTQIYNGYTYKTIRIGTQWWFAENLRTTNYNDGTIIPIVTDNSAWAILTTGAYCWYKNDEEVYRNLYGALYNWYAVNTGKLCPAGWHVPSKQEWNILETMLGFAHDQTFRPGIKRTDQGRQMKSTTGWYNNGNGTNSSGFSGLPGGYRMGDGIYTNVGNEGNWWSFTARSSEVAWGRYLDNNSSEVQTNYGSSRIGFSVRCIMD